MTLSTRALINVKDAQPSVLQFSWGEGYVYHQKDQSNGSNEDDSVTAASPLSGARPEKFNGGGWAWATQDPSDRKVFISRALLLARSDSTSHSVMLSATHCYQAFLVFFFKS